MFVGTVPDDDISVAGAWIALVTICGLLLYILNRKLRVCEVAG
jgi:hypothetical protein